MYAYIPTFEGLRRLTPDERTIVDAFVAAYLARTGALPDGVKKVYGFGRVMFSPRPLCGDEDLEKDVWQ